MLFYEDIKQETHARWTAKKNQKINVRLFNSHSCRKSIQCIMYKI